YYRQIFNESEFEKFKKFTDTYREIVFLRDLLDLSLALSMNFGDDGNHTEIGELEKLAKYEKDKEAELRLMDKCKQWLTTLPYYKNADYICAMPCSNRRQKSLPRRIVDEMEGFENISDNVYWRSKTNSLKNAETVEEKLA